MGSILSWGWLAKFFFQIGDSISPAGKPKILLRMYQGKCRLITGKVPGWVRNSVEELFLSSAQGKGFVRLSKDGRFQFSRNISPRIQQRIRNIISSR